MYKITITKIITKDLPAGRDWKVIAERPITKEDLQESPYDYSTEGADRFELKKVYGYTPAQTKPREVEMTVLEQQVEELNLVAVIKAINNIP